MKSKRLECHWIECIPSISLCGILYNKLVVCKIIPESAFQLLWASRCCLLHSLSWDPVRIGGSYLCIVAIDRILYCDLKT